MTGRDRQRLHSLARLAEDMEREDVVYSEPLTREQMRSRAAHIRAELDDLMPGRRRFAEGRGNFDGGGYD